MKICALCMAMTMVFPSDQVLAGKTKRKFIILLLVLRNLEKTKESKKKEY